MRPYQYVHTHRTVFILVGVVVALVVAILIGMYMRQVQHLAAVAAEAAAKEAAIAEKAAIQKAILAEQTSFGWPVRIRIPAIGVDTKLVNVGLKADGSLDAPVGPKEAGWFRTTALPGSASSTAVIDGHSGWSHGIHAVFDDLYKLKLGDTIYLEDQKGIILTFVTRDSARFGEHDDISSIFHSEDGVAHLNLITCNGVWEPASHTYDKRFVAYADLMESK